MTGFRLAWHLGVDLFWVVIVLRWLRDIGEWSGRQGRRAARWWIMHVPDRDESESED